MTEGKIKKHLVGRIHDLSRKINSAILDMPKPKCKFHRYCPLYRDDSYTCNNDGGNYCGIYRDLQCRGTFRHIIPLSLILLTISFVLFVFSISFCVIST